MCGCSVWGGCGTGVDEFEEKAQVCMGLDVWVQCLGRWGTDVDNFEEKAQGACGFRCVCV